MRVNLSYLIQRIQTYYFRLTYMNNEVELRCEGESGNFPITQTVVSWCISLIYKTACIECTGIGDICTSYKDRTSRIYSLQIKIQKKLIDFQSCL